MSLFSKLASNLSGQNQRKASSTIDASKYRENQPKQIWWQCRYCGKRSGTWSNSNSMPRPGVCDARGRVNGIPKPHEWHKVR